MADARPIVHPCKNRVLGRGSSGRRTRPSAPVPRKSLARSLTYEFACATAVANIPLAMLARGIAGTLIAALCAASALAATLEDVAESGVYKVRGIRIEGARAIGAGAVRDVMQTRVPPWYQPLRRWRERPLFNASVLRDDLARIETLLREAGYYEGRVACALEVTDDGVTIVLTIDEGPAARVAEIQVVARDFALQPEDEKRLRHLLALAPGALFTQEAYDASRARLETFYAVRAFAYVEVAKSATVDTDTDLVHVTYAITRGAPAVFGATRVTGTAEVDPRLVQRELAYRSGDPYDPRKLEETRASVFGLRLFRSVSVRPGNLAERSGVVEITIAVVEGPAREIAVGIGYGLEDEVRGQLRWQNNNFLGGGRQLGFRLKGSSIEQSLEGEFRQPFFLAPRQTLIVPLTQARDDEPGYTVVQLRLAPRIERTLLPRLKGSFGYNIEYDDLSDVPQATIARLDGYRPRGYVSSLIGVVEYNTTVDLLDPREGRVVNLTLEQAGGPWGGDYTFARGLLEAKAYLPVHGEAIAAGRFRIGGGNGFGQSSDLPLFRRFYAGGINSTRGYGRSLVGPLNEYGDPVGGRSLLEGSLELRAPIYKKVGGVVFLDAGEVRRRAFSYTLGDIQLGAGVGVRYQTIVGPLRVDLGFPFDPPSGEPSWKIHFSVGQAF